MNMHRALLIPVALSVLVAIPGGLAWLAGAPARAAEAWNTKTVSISGTVSGRPESVDFSGDAKVGSRLAPDPDFNSPSLVLAIDLSHVSGVGSSTGKKYVISGPEMVHRPLAASDKIVITFPFFESGTRGTSGARPGLASFALSIDTATGAVTGARAAISTPSF